MTAINTKTIIAKANYRDATPSGNKLVNKLPKNVEKIIKINEHSDIYYNLKNGSLMKTCEINLLEQNYLLPIKLWDKHLIPNHILPSILAAGKSRSGKINIKLFKQFNVI